MCAVPLSHTLTLRRHVSPACCPISVCFLRSLRTGACPVHLVLKPGYLNLFNSPALLFNKEGKSTYRAVVSHLRLPRLSGPTLLQVARAPPLGRAHILFLEYLFTFFTLSPFPSPVKMLVHAGGVERRQNHRIEACLGLRAQHQFRTNLNKKQDPVSKGVGDGD